MRRVLILHGPNLNLLGTREPEVYGSQTLQDIDAACQQKAAALDITIQCRQSNHEGELVDWLHGAATAADGVILNAGAYTHTSVALHDAIKAITVPVIEVHLSNPHRREDFRHHSYLSSVVAGVICGFGATSYLLALDAMAALIGRK